VTQRNDPVDQNLLTALVKAYTARAKLFHQGVQGSAIDMLIAEIDAIPDNALQWTPMDIGVTETAFHHAAQAGAKPHQVFAHPALIVDRPHLIAYYRNLATISQKGIAQIAFPTRRLEDRKSSPLSERDARDLCTTLNKIISGVIDSIPNYRLSLSRQAIVAEIGSQLQGTWANLVGQGASKAVEAVIARHVSQNALGTRIAPGHYELTNGWTIRFASEPDVAFFDRHGIKQIAIEIKGSLDRAGAQTRYGETKKSFQKQLAENPRCHTIYLASCFTDSVISQIQADGQVREWFNLTSILYDEDERSLFLRRVFHLVSAPARPG